MEFVLTLTEPQKEIYYLIKTYLKKYPHFTIYELFLYCKRNSKIPDFEIHNIIERFISKKIIIEGSRLTRDEVLHQNQTRFKIYNFIIKNPGIYFNYILKEFNIGPHVARWHIEMLKKFDFIREKKYLIYKLYFIKDFPERKEIQVFLLRNENVFNILLSLMNNYFKASEISQILNKAQSTIQYHLERMKKNDLIIKNFNNKYSINLATLSFLNKYFDFTIPNSLQTRIKNFLNSNL
ncbi:MAG: ArsR family transcriptional regulator [Candidatus Helarchaeota archaeon]